MGSGIGSAAEAVLRAEERGHLDALSQQQIQHMLARAVASRLVAEDCHALPFKQREV